MTKAIPDVERIMLEPSYTSFRSTNNRQCTLYDDDPADLLYFTLEMVKHPSLLAAYGYIPYDFGCVPEGFARLIVPPRISPIAHCHL